MKSRSLIIEIKSKMFKIKSQLTATKKSWLILDRCKTILWILRNFTYGRTNFILLTMPKAVK